MQTTSTSEVFSRRIVALSDTAPFCRLTASTRPVQGAAALAIADLADFDESDVALIRRTRVGDRSAYGVLHDRHVDAARALAWRMSRSVADADDLVAEGFARVLGAIQRGRGPEVAFRPYLLSTIRRLAYDRTDRERREAPVDYDLDEPTIVASDPVVDGFERETASAAFDSLPERWRMVLWHTEVEGQTPAQVAVLLGITPNAVAALAYRAREGLRQAYLARHAPAPVADATCRYTSDRLAAHVRNALPPVQDARVSSHLETCDDCRAAYLELASVNTSLRSLVGVAVLGPIAGPHLAGLAAGVTAAAAAPVGAAVSAPAVGGLSRLARAASRAPKPPAAVGAALAGVVASAALVVGAVVWAQRGDSGSQVGREEVASADRVELAQVDSKDTGASRSSVTVPPTSAGDPSAPPALVPSDDSTVLRPGQPRSGQPRPDAGIFPPALEPAAPAPPGTPGAPPAVPVEPAQPVPSPVPASPLPAPTSTTSPLTTTAPTPPSSTPSTAPPTVPATTTTAPPPSVTTTTVPDTTVPATTTSAPVTTTTAPATTTTVPVTPTTGPVATTSTTVPVTTTTTTTPTTTTTTTIPSGPRAATKIHSAGRLVSGRAGVLTVVLHNDSGTAMTDVVLAVDLTSASLRDEPRSMNVGGQPAWTCSSETLTRVVCTAASIDVGGQAGFYLPVLVDGPATDVTVAVSTSIGGISEGGDGSPTVLIPVHTDGLSARYAAVENGGVATAGNNLISCPEASPGCTDGQGGVGSQLDNGSFAMVEIDGDADASTSNSSSDEIVLPPGAVVTSATLYVAGALNGGAGGADAPAPGSAGVATITDPSGVASVVVAERVDQVGSRFQSVTDVTAVVSAGGPGRWTVGGAQLATGEGTFGGWVLVVTFAAPSQPMRSVVVLDGLGLVDPSQPASYAVGGFVVPVAGASSATVTAITWEGDAGLSGDQLSVGGTPVANASNPLGNSFNSTSSTDGAPNLGRIPGGTNMFGVDIDRFDVSGLLPAGTNETTIQFSTVSDVFMPGVVAFSIDQ